MGAIWFIRHGESEWNAAGRWQGQADPPLSARGRAQAAALAGAIPGLAALRDVRLVASDLARARETAEILGAALGVAPRFDARLREHHVGAWSGHTHAEIEQRWPDDYARFRAGDLAIAPGGGESRLALRARVHPAFAELAAGGGTLVVVSHAGVLRALVPDASLLPGAWLRLDSLAESGAQRDTRAPEPSAL